MLPGGEVDWTTLRSHVECQIAAGIDGLVPVGTTGESPTLDQEEHLKVIEEVVKTAEGRVPVIAGTGANSTAEALQLTKEAEKRGADAFLQVAPYYNKPSQEGLYQHFARIAESTERPLMLYSIPGRCGVAIAVETVARLFAQFPQVNTIKEAGGDVTRVQELRTAAPGVNIVSGDDGLIGPFVAAGAEGVVSVAANFRPDVVLSYTTACREGRRAAAMEIWEQWHPLFTELVFMAGNPVTIKEVLYTAEKIPHPELRLPLVRMEETQRARVRSLLKDLEEAEA
jgi:4-hydroxy-tetrahydrodipicolinate synthase